MDFPSINKIQTINNYSLQHLISNLLLYTLTTMLCSLFVFSPLWYPPLRISVSVFLFVSLPKVISLFFSTKFLFIVGNLIIVFLVGEFKKYKVPHSSEVPCTWGQILPSPPNKERETPKLTLEEHMRMKLKSRLLEKGTTPTNVDRCEPQNEEAPHLGAQNCQMIPFALKPNDTNKVTHIYEESLMFGEGYWERKEGNGKKSDGEDLNKRADDFIARVNKQRRLEAELYSVIE